MVFLVFDDVTLPCARSLRRSEIKLRGIDRWTGQLAAARIGAKTQALEQAGVELRGKLGVIGSRNYAFNQTDPL